LSHDLTIRLLKGKAMADKNYRVAQNVGKARHVVSFFTGEKFHKDGSAFCDVAIFSNKVACVKFTRKLDAQGYTNSYRERESHEQSL